MSENTQNTQEKPKSKWQERELGALWRVDGRNQSFYSGSIKVGDKTVKVVCFPNKDKEPDSNQPDLRVYESEDREPAT
jgi:hypothetical protein